MDKANETMKGLPFGVRMRAGNFYVEKISRALSKKDAKALRKEFLASIPGLPKGYKGSQRASMPVMRVGDIGGMWRIEYAVTSSMFHVIDAFAWGTAPDGECWITDETCNRLLTMMFCDTTVLGDREYVEARVKALNGFMERVKESGASDEDDERAVELLKAFQNMKEADNG